MPKEPGQQPHHFRNTNTAAGRELPGEPGDDPENERTGAVDDQTPPREANGTAGEPPHIRPQFFAQLPDRFPSWVPQQWRPALCRFLAPQQFSNISHRLFLGYCCVAALSIGLTATFVVSAVVYWALFSWYGRRLRRLGAYPSALPETDPLDGAPSSTRRIKLRFAIEVWIGFAFIAAVVGIHPGRALPECAKLALYMSVPFCVLASLSVVPLSAREFVIRIESYLACLIGSQSVAALFTIFVEGLSLPVKRLIPGPVTESGQLVLILPLVGAAALLALSRAQAEKASGETATEPGAGREPPLSTWRTPLLSLVIFLGLVVIAWPGMTANTGNALPPTEVPSTMSGLFRIGAALLALGALLIHLLRTERSSGAPSVFGGNARWMRAEVLIWPAGALLLAALVVNLKRGPWCGVLIELLVLGFLLSRRSLLLLLVSFIIFLGSLTPTRDRLTSLGEHFAISGGRKSMWELGAELAQRYPLGIGLSNASYMRRIDPSLPELHRHMHNNVLNIAVETGWFGMAAYCWWMVAVCALGIAVWRRTVESKGRLERQFGLLALCITAALIGWQTAGLVEFNFGDGEVRALAFFTMGMLLALDRWIDDRNQRRLSG